MFKVATWIPTSTRVARNPRPSCEILRPGLDLDVPGIELAIYGLHGSRWELPNIRGPNIDPKQWSSYSKDTQEREPIYRNSQVRIE